MAINSILQCHDHRDFLIGSWCLPTKIAIVEPPQKNHHPTEALNIAFLQSCLKNTDFLQVASASEDILLRLLCWRGSTQISESRLKHCKPSFIPSDLSWMIIGLSENWAGSPVPSIFRLHTSIFQTVALGYRRFWDKPILILRSNVETPSIWATKIPEKFIERCKTEKSAISLLACHPSSSYRWKDPKTNLPWWL